jgi:hypothetical protein
MVLLDTMAFARNRMGQQVQSPGNPVPNYYANAPLISVALAQSTDGGISHGANVSPSTKCIRKTTFMSDLATSLPVSLLLLDYLLYYPFCDEGTTDEQVLINTVSLPRYSDGLGVKIMMVSVAPRTGGQSVTVKYTNELGVSGRVTTATIQNSAALNGTIVSSSINNTNSAYPFLTLQGKDLGVRSIQSVTMLGADVGLFALVLVKPILQTTIIEQTAPVEVDYLINRAMSMPVVVDDAYLNLIALSSTGIFSGVTYLGDIKYIWK